MFWSFLGAGKILSTREKDLCPGQYGKSSSLSDLRSSFSTFLKPLPNWNPPGTQGCILKYINPYFLRPDKLSVESLNQGPNPKRNQAASSPQCGSDSISSSAISTSANSFTRAVQVLRRKVQQIITTKLEPHPQQWPFLPASLTNWTLVLFFFFFLNQQKIFSH